MFLVYKTDSWHRYGSRDVLAIASTYANAILLCTLQAEKEGEKLDTDQLHNLANLRQTQGYSGEGEFQYEYFEIDTLL